jgi:hypothetical protein
MSNHLDLYLKLERIMMELDDQDDPIADRMRDLMDPVWYGLPEEDRNFLDGRGEMDVRVLYPVTLKVPDLFHAPVAETPIVEIKPENGVGKHFALKEVIPWAAQSWEPTGLPIVES